MTAEVGCGHREGRFRDWVCRCNDRNVVARIRGGGAPAQSTSECGYKAVPAPRFSSRQADAWLDDTGRYDSGVRIFSRSNLANFRSWTVRALTAPH